MKLRDELRDFFSAKGRFEVNASVYPHAGDQIVDAFIKWFSSLNEAGRAEIVDLLIDDVLSDSSELSKTPGDTETILSAVVRACPSVASASSLDYLQSELQRADLINAWRRELDSESEPDTNRKKTWRYGNILWGILYRTRPEAAGSYLAFIGQIDVAGNLLREFTRTRDIIDGAIFKKWGR